MHGSSPFGEIIRFCQLWYFALCFKISSPSTWVKFLIFQSQCLLDRIWLHRFTLLLNCMGTLLFYSLFGLDTRKILLSAHTDFSMMPDFTCLHLNYSVFYTLQGGGFLWILSFMRYGTCTRVNTSTGDSVSPACLGGEGHEWNIHSSWVRGESLTPSIPHII